MEIAQIIDNVLYEYYSEKGLPVPRWRKTEVEWWTKYLLELGMDPKNP